MDLVHPCVFWSTRTIQNMFFRVRQ